MRRANSAPIKHVRRAPLGSHGTLRLAHRDLARLRTASAGKLACRSRRAVVHLPPFSKARVPTAMPPRRIVGCPTQGVAPDLVPRIIGDSKGKENNLLMNL